MRKQKDAASQSRFIDKAKDTKRIAAHVQPHFYPRNQFPWGLMPAKPQLLENHLVLSRYP
jgi:hypothetical protein